MSGIRSGGRAAALGALAVALWGALPGFARSEELPAAYRCSGNEPFWGLVVEGAQATYTELGEPERELEGGFRSLDWAGTFVFRGRAVGEQGAWVAVIERRSCLETMAEEEEGGGEMPFAVVLSRPDGEARLGCCRPAERSVAPSSGD